MKTRVLVIVLLLLFLIIVMTQKDGRIVDLFLSVINPVKQTYTNVTREVEDKGQSFVYQKETIQKLYRENKYLRKRLLEQKHYIQQVSDLYKRIPSLERIPHKSVDIVQTISYVKLNTFSQVILTKPQDFNGSKEKFYGLVQGGVAAGVAQLHNNNLYGALVSNEKCRFTVFVGKNRAAGIAIGIDAKSMYVKFIPKWSKIEPGDEVVTSGLDTIFFANIPVGAVERVEVESSYKVAYIKPYADVLHPDYFYMIKDTSVTLASKYDGKYTSECNNTKSMTDQNQTLADQNLSASDANRTLDSMLDPEISAIPSVLPEEPKNIIQTQEEEVSSEQLQPPAETQRRPAKKKQKTSRPKVDNLDMF